MKRILILVFLILLVNPLAVPICTGSDYPDVLTLKKQAARGNVDAQLELGEAYYYGEGVLKDPSTAKFWIQKAYENGSAEAQEVWENLELWKIPDNPNNNPGNRKPFRKKRKPVWTEPVTGMKFIWIPSGCFSMGCKKKEAPSHKVCLTGFWIGQYEITQNEYEKIMGTNPSRFYNSNHPVENVSWEDTMRFISRLNTKTTTHRYEFSLPSEAQWEYACRNLGKKNAFPWDENLTGNMANCGNCLTDQYNGSTAPVGSFPSNKIKLFDMGGNVAEWCLDVYDKNAYSGHANLNPVNKKGGSSHTIRGGSFADNIENLRCAYRKGAVKFMKTDYIGFRIVRKESQ
ncbi:MAG: SUMF1/EgtB/PvdO family nonheme iron enzyme [Desulfobacteraceae bacterium]|nr:SUMF1/EgtB/PvdO family nonheme iron enzyme [Desulfobacteraceae bacterium]